jgi:hypothetical protein
VAFRPNLTWYQRNCELWIRNIFRNLSVEIFFSKNISMLLGVFFYLQDASFFGASWRNYELTVEFKEVEIAKFSFHFIPVGQWKPYLRGFEVKGFLLD